jgi:spore coat polysaccharide biosynthesis protein SpsF
MSFDGVLKKMKPLIIIQCRFSSTRLPGKALYPINGIPILVFLIRRLKCVSIKGKIIVATTERPEDDPVAAWAEYENVEVVRGETDDVLSRYLKCLEIFPSNIVVRVTGDNPLTDPGIINLVIDEMGTGNWDYINTINGYPYGAGVDAFKSVIIQDLNKVVHDSAEREHLDLHIHNNKKRFQSCDMAPPDELARDDVRITIDTLEDWQRMEMLLSNIKEPLKISLKDVIKRFDSLSF